MQRFFKILDMGQQCVDELCSNYNQDNAKKLESLTQMAQDEILLKSKELLGKYPTDENRKAYESIVNVSKNGNKLNRYKYR